MAKPNKILVAFDGSKPSTLALYYALELASIIGDEVILLHVIKPGKVDNQVKIHALTMLKAAKNKADERHVKSSVRVSAGDPAEEIVKESKKGVRQIVMGSHGTSNLENILVGSVAERVIKKSRIPVTVVK